MSSEEDRVSVTLSGLPRTAQLLELGLRSPDPTSPTPSPPTWSTCLPGSTLTHLPGSSSPRCPKAWLSPFPLHLSHLMPLSASASPTSIRARVREASRYPVPRSTASCKLCLLNTPCSCAFGPCPVATGPQLSPGILQSLLEATQPPILTPPIPSLNPGTVSQFPLWEMKVIYVC